MCNAIVIIYSRGVLQPSGIRRFCNRVSTLSPLRPDLGNGDPLIEILRNALTFERVLQRPAPCPKSSVDNQSVENAIPIQSVSSNYLAPGSWAYVRRLGLESTSKYKYKCACWTARTAERRGRRRRAQGVTMNWHLCIWHRHNGITHR